MNTQTPPELDYETGKLTFRKGLVATGSLGEELLALGDGLAAESDTLLGVEDGALPDEALDTTGTTIDLVEGHLVDNLGAMFPVFNAGVSQSDVRESSTQSGTDFRRALISSIFWGSCSAKRSFRVCQQDEVLAQELFHKGHPAFSRRSSPVSACTCVLAE